MQHGINPFLEFSPNDRQIYRASREYLRISFVQNELRLNSGNSVETGKIHGFDFNSPKLRSLKKDFQLFFEKH
jgi:hypothetical protein